MVNTLASTSSGVDAAAAADRLRDLAHDERFTTRSADLASLADALDSPDGDLQGWDTVDLFDAFTPESSIEIRRAGRNALEWAISLAAAVAVFLPVAWTWFSMFNAAGAYGDWLSAAPEGASANFLQLWVNGFDGRLDQMHRLDTMALVSVALILLAVAMLVAQRMVTAHRDRVEDRAFRAAEAELAETLTLASRAVVLGAVAGARGVEAMVRESVRALRKAHDATARSAAELEATVTKATQTLNGALATVQPLLADVQSTTGTMSATATVMSDSAVKAGLATKAAVETLAAEVTSSSQHWRSSHLAAVDASRQAMSDAATAHLAAVDARNQAMVDATTSMQAGLAGMVDSGNDLARSVQQLTAAGQQVPALVTSAVQGSLGGVASQIASEIATFDRAAGDMADVLERMDGALTGNQSAMQAQVSELTAARDALEQLLRHLEKSTPALSRR